MTKITAKKVTGTVNAVGNSPNGNYLVTVTPKSGSGDVLFEVRLDPIALALNLQDVYQVGDKVKYLPSKDLKGGTGLEKAT